MLFMDSFPVGRNIDVSDLVSRGNTFHHLLSHTRVNGFAANNQRGAFAMIIVLLNKDPIRGFLQHIAPQDNCASCTKLVVLVHYTFLFSFWFPFSLVPREIFIVGIMDSPGFFFVSIVLCSILLCSLKVWNKVDTLGAHSMAAEDFLPDQKLLSGVF